MLGVAACRGCQVACTCEARWLVSAIRNWRSLRPCNHFSRWYDTHTHTRGSGMVLEREAIETEIERQITALLYKLLTQFLCLIYTDDDDDDGDDFIFMPPRRSFFLFLLLWLLQCLPHFLLLSLLSSSLLLLLLLPFCRLSRFSFRFSTLLGLKIVFGACYLCGSMQFEVLFFLH